MAYDSLTLRPTLMFSILTEVMGRLDHLVEAVYERFKDRYFKTERTSYWLSPHYFSRPLQLCRRPCRYIRCQVRALP